MRRVLGPAGVALAMAGAACGGAHGPSTPDAGWGPVVLASVPARPRGLLLEAVLRDPDAAWSRLQEGAGGAFAVLPPALGPLVCAALGVDRDLGALVDGHAAAYGVVVQRAGAAPAPGGAGDVGWAVALRLTADGARKATSMQSAARPAGFDQRLEGGMDILTRPDSPLPVALAIAQGWLVVASDERDLLESGPYVIGALPAPPASVSLSAAASFVALASHVALVGPVSAALSSRWDAARVWLLEQGRVERDRHGGRPPDFADPEAIVAALESAIRRGLASTFRDRDLRIEGEVGADDVTVEVRAVMSDASASVTGDASASTPALGDALPLGDVPVDVPLAVLVRSDAAERAETAHALTNALAEVLGSRMRDEQATAVASALAGWGRARGDWMALGPARVPEGGFWVRAPAAAAATVDVAPRAIHELLALSRLPPLRDPLANWLHRLPVVFGPPAGKASTANFPAAGGAPAPVAGVTWAMDGGELTIGAGAHPLQRMADVTSPGARWSDEPRTARVLADLGDSTSLAALAQPLRLGVAGAHVTSAPLAFAWGRKGGDPWARVDIADELLAAGVRLSAGF